jgi:hypothetical protein
LNTNRSGWAATAAARPDLVHGVDPAQVHGLGSPRGAGGTWCAPNTGRCAHRAARRRPRRVRRHQRARSGHAPIARAAEVSPASGATSLTAAISSRSLARRSQGQSESPGSSKTLLARRRPFSVWESVGGASGYRCAMSDLPVPGILTWTARRFGRASMRSCLAPSGCSLDGCAQPSQRAVAAQKLDGLEQRG